MALTGCGNSPPAAFSNHSEAHRTAGVRFASSFAAAFLDSLLAHPVCYSDARRPVCDTRRMTQSSSFSAACSHRDNQ